jgi:hypothetical protein
LKASELDAVRFILEKEWPDGTSSDTVARAAIKAIDDIRDTMWRPIGPPLQVDSVFKHHFTSSTLFVRWIGVDAGGVELAWIVAEDSDYGHIARTDSLFWRWSTPVKESKGITRNIKVIDPETGEQLIDEDGNPVTEKKFYPPVAERIKVNAIGMVVGDKIHVRNVGNYTVVATAPGGVLLLHQKTGWHWAESNHGIQRYYKDGWIR